MLRAPSKNNMSNIRDLFARDHKEKVPPDLRYALNLLRLDGFEDLEERILATDAFLRPWSMFRDTVFLRFPDAMPHPTQITPIGVESISGVSRLDILWFYTQFDEGTLRYDPRADKYSSEYTPDTTVYGLIDKSKWRMEEYEKHLHTWLLQEFKVGKSYSPWRFQCFELANICTVWEDVLVPIVNAVRASYHPLGRRHYGRLALLIEARCPSQLAFPGSNIDVPASALLSPTPYRVVSVPKRITDDGAARGVLTKTHYDMTERELRDVYPQYGGLVERPKFKHKMEEWLAEQRARADRRRGHEKRGSIHSFQARITQQDLSRSPSKQFPQSPRGSIRKQPASGSPIKRVADSFKRSVSNTISSMRTKDEQKSPLHGVTRQLQLPDPPRRNRAESWELPYDPTRDSMTITPLPRPQARCESTGLSVYSSIRNSNPFTEDVMDLPKATQAYTNAVESRLVSGEQRSRAETNDSVFSPMGQMSAIPHPLHIEPDVARRAELEDTRIDDFPNAEPNGGAKTASHDIRMPSYEGTHYQQEISLTNLHTRRMNKNRSPELARAKTPATRLPAPIVPIPYAGPRVASADTPSKSTAPLAKPVLSAPKPIPVPAKSQVAPAKSIAWPGPAATKPKPIAWPDSPSPSDPAWLAADSDDDEFLPPPIPAKSPERQIRNPRSRQPQRGDDEHEIFRTVSKENIHAALRAISRESSTENLAPAKTLAEPDRTMSPMKQHLQTYNSHMFPRKDERKGTPVGGWVKGETRKGRVESGDTYELRELEGGKKNE